VRDRLIELLNVAVGDSNIVKIVADYLLANGVVVPPCKVGDTVYRTSGNYFGEKIFEGVVAQISIYNNGEIRFWEHGHPLSFTPNDFGKTVFLTREEAEQKLRGDGE
jgi:hypothetical protein